MFFITSKFVWALIAPSSLMIWLICFNALLFILNKQRVAKRLFFFNFWVFFIIGCTAIPSIALNKWEQQYPLQKTLPADVEGIIVLGGAIDISETRRQERLILTPLNNGRIYALTNLLLSYPEAKFIYSGGNSYISSPTKNIPESVLAESYMKSIYNGSDHNLYFETQSKNTYQNAVFSKMLYKEQIGDQWPNDKQWLLVTSGYHMPRAYQVFKAAGWRVLPYPSDHTKKAPPPWMLTTKFWNNWYKIDVLAREMVGIIAYKLTHKI